MHLAIAVGGSASCRRIGPMNSLTRWLRCSKPMACCDSMLIRDLNNSAAVSNELLRGYVPLCVIGLPADDFKVSNRLGCDVINGRQHCKTPLVGSALSLGILVFVFAQQRWIQL